MLTKINNNVSYFSRMLKKAVLLFSLFFFCIQHSNAEEFISPQHEDISYHGRFEFRDINTVTFAWPGSCIEFNLEAQHLVFKLSQFSVSDTNHYGSKNYYYLLDNDEAPIKFWCGSIDSTYRFELPASQSSHNLRIYKLTESHVGIGAFHGLLLNEGHHLIERKKVHQTKIEFIGNSITCGYGNEGDNQHCDFSPQTENNYLSYAAIAAREIDYDPSFIAWSGKGVLRNYDMDSIHTLPSIFNRTIALEDKEWSFEKHEAPEIVVINLGTNDYAHQNPDSVKFQQAYSQLIFQVRYYYPDAKIVCLIGPMMSEGWPKNHHVLSSFSNTLTSLLQQLRTIGVANLYSFEMKAQGDYGYGCDWHPSVKQHAINGLELAAFLRAEVITKN